VGDVLPAYDIVQAEQQFVPPSESRGLAVVGVSKKYGRHPVLTRLSLDVKPGEVVGLLGRDGAGKTVCFYCILGLAEIDEGQILLSGQDMTNLPLDQRARLGLGYLPEDNSIFQGMSVAENIMAVLELFVPEQCVREQRLNALLAEFRIDYVRDTAARALSGGERRRCEIARAMAASPIIMLLDAPFAGLDPLSIATIKAAVLNLKARGVGILISDQNIHDLLDVLDRVYVIHDSRILFQGIPSVMLHDRRVQDFYLGDDVP
jgi:lipopolysaccharide export system ATP-binding protein